MLMNVLRKDIELSNVRNLGVLQLVGILVSEIQTKNVCVHF